jgi:hypothetical protein
MGNRLGKILLSDPGVSMQCGTPQLDVLPAIFWWVTDVKINALMGIQYSEFGAIWVGIEWYRSDHRSLNPGCGAGIVNRLPADSLLRCGRGVQDGDMSVWVRAVIHDREACNPLQLGALKDRSVVSEDRVEDVTGQDRGHLQGWMDGLCDDDTITILLNPVGFPGSMVCMDNNPPAGGFVRKGGARGRGSQVHPGEAVSVTSSGNAMKVSGVVTLSHIVAAWIKQNCSGGVWTSDCKYPTTGFGDPRRLGALLWLKSDEESVAVQ